MNTNPVGVSVHQEQDVALPLAWAVCEEPGGRIVAYCASYDDAERIQKLLFAGFQNNVTVLLHLDGKEVAKAVIPHLASTIRNDTGSRNF